MLKIQCQKDKIWAMLDTRPSTENTRYESDKTAEKSGILL